ncbi:DUF6798 domain-containing protein [Sorangium cellulosum]|uniref:DUF6798 domain-containing protein n=1 Tax=Sorangium cellulosum So0157-2 TaxID=1254432 RepID=S4XRK6_SORCE|nr:DUF6798 domain-containing protein [Sorangium cellulosum]AGP35149.1 hypothetical protein SCE1572_11875 [Sorangium cellulosum So0157-2]
MQPATDATRPAAEPAPDPEDAPRADHDAAGRAWSWLAPCAVFGAVASMSRSFVSNQNTYLVHAARSSGAYPELAADWFAHTADPTPFFTGLVAPLLALAGPGVLPALNAILTAACLAAIVLAAEALVPDGAPRAPRWVVACALAVAWLASPRAQYGFAGVADQQVLRNFLQPANFGVLLLVGLALLLRGRPRAGAAIAALAAVMHPTYIPSVLLLVGAALALDRAAPWRRKAVAAALAGAVLAPPLLWTATRFAPSDPATFRAAQRILADERIPHHTSPQLWFDLGAVLCALIVAAALLIARRSGKALLGAYAGVCVLGTLAAAAFPQLYTLRLAFPWRISTWLVPLSTAVLFTALLGRLMRRPARRVLPGIAAGVWVIATAVAVRQGLHRMRPREEAGVALAREARRRGAATDVIVSPPAWEHLRLNAPAAIFADWKSHPYADREVLEWDRRVGLLSGLYAGAGALSCGALAPILASAPAPRWVIVPRGASLSCPGVELAVEGADGSLYRVLAAPPPG